MRLASFVNFCNELSNNTFATTKVHISAVFAVFPFFCVILLRTRLRIFQWGWNGAFSQANYFVTSFFQQTFPFVFPSSEAGFNRLFLSTVFSSIRLPLPLSKITSHLTASQLQFPTSTASFPWLQTTKSPCCTNLQRVGNLLRGEQSRTYRSQR